MYKLNIIFTLISGASEIGTTTQDMTTETMDGTITTLSTLPSSLIKQSTVRTTLSTLPSSLIQQSTVREEPTPTFVDDVETTDAQDPTIIPVQTTTWKPVVIPKCMIYKQAK